VEVLAFAKQRKPFQVQFGLKNPVKNTGIYRYSDGGISVFGICDIDPLYNINIFPDIIFLILFWVIMYRYSFQFSLMVPQISSNFSYDY
jgi:hypothetical protein